MTEQKGFALVFAVMAVAMLSALAVSLAVVTDTEVRVLDSQLRAEEADAAAAAGLELVLMELQGLDEWDGVLTGAVRSRFVDGPPGGQRTLADGSILQLEDLTADVDGSGWRLFAYGTYLRPAGIASDAYVVCWVSASPAGPETLEVRADAFGQRATRRAFRARMARRGVLSWQQVL